MSRQRLWPLALAGLCCLANCKNQEASRTEEILFSGKPFNEHIRFRPVAIKLGPDGTIYVAEFYNSIIGHYEVPLDHSKRDKKKGRIWRITHTGAVTTTENIHLQEKNINEFISALDNDNLHIRMTIPWSGPM